MFAHIIPARRNPLSLPWFDYSIPNELLNKIKVGQLVIIPFRSKMIFGVVESLIATSTVKNVKPIADLLHGESFLSIQQLAFLKEMASLYHTSLGFLVKSNLPPLQKRKLEKLKKAATTMTSINASTHQSTGGGSSKTELSIHQSELEKKKHFYQHYQAGPQTLILVPHLADIPHWIMLLEPREQQQMMAVTSEMTPPEMFEAWQQIWVGVKTIIIGTRSALFLPWRNLATIFMDDEGNSNYKSWDMAPRYHTRDAAQLLAEQHHAKLHLMSHTPSLESYFFGKKNIYQLDTKLESLHPDKITITDISQERRGGNFSMLSADLQQAIEQTTAGTIFLFLNRRGTLRSVSCADCQFVFTCASCQRPLIWHEDKRVLACHYCAQTLPLTLNCPSCGGLNITMFGRGTKQLEIELKKMSWAKHFKILRIDHDSANDVDLTLRQNFETETASTNTNQTKEKQIIFIGTELAWNKLTWSVIKLMAVIEADTPFFVPEYRAAEDWWQTLRDSRYRLPPEAELFIQTSRPDHLIFKSLFSPEQFYKQELLQRKLLNYPPFYYLLKLYYNGADKTQVVAEAKRVFAQLYQLTKQNLHITINPPLAMFPEFERGSYRQVIMIRVAYRNYKQLLRIILSHVPETWKVDLNPNTLLST